MKLLQSAGLFLLSITLHCVDAFSLDPWCNTNIPSTPACQVNLGAGAAANISTGSKVYCLTGNIPSLTITADNVTFDGKGFSVGSGLNLNNLTGVRVANTTFSGSISCNDGGGNIIDKSTFTSMSISRSNYNRYRCNIVNSASSDGVAIWNVGNPDEHIFNKGNFIQYNQINGNGNMNTRFVEFSHARDGYFEGNEITLLNAGHINGDVSVLFAMYYSTGNTLSRNTLRMTINPATSFDPVNGNIGAMVRDQSSLNLFEFNKLTALYRTLSLTSGNDVGSSHDNIYFGNEIKGTTYVLHMQQLMGTTLFQNNLFQGSGGVLVDVAGVTSGSQARLINNTFVGSGDSLVWADGVDTNRQTYWRNNILYSLDPRRIFSLASGISIDSNYNLLARGNVPPGNPNPMMSYAGVDYSSLASWKGPGHDQNSIGWDEVSQPSSPLFMSKDTGDFRLISNSVAKGAGEGGVDLGYASFASNACTPRWECSSWGSCVSNTHSRTCHDANNCSLPSTAPPTSMACLTNCTQDWRCTAWRCDNRGTASDPSDDVLRRWCSDYNLCDAMQGVPSVIVAAPGCPATNPQPPGCVPNWTCTSWSACSGATKTRTCSDSNACGTTLGKPTQSIACKTLVLDTLPPTAPSNLQVQ